MEWPTSGMYEETLSYLKKQLPEKALQPNIAIICGSGLSLLAEAVENSTEFLASLDYTDIPHFLRSTGKTAQIFQQQSANLHHQQSTDMLESLFSEGCMANSLC